MGLTNQQEVLNGNMQINMKTLKCIYRYLAFIEKHVKKCRENSLFGKM